MPAASVDPDRRAAEWVLSHEGEVTVAEQGKAAVYIHPGEPLPAAPFRVQLIEFGGSEQSIEDSELDFLQGVTNLQELNFTQLRGYSDAGLKNLSGLERRHSIQTYVETSAGLTGGAMSCSMIVTSSPGIPPSA